MKAVRRGGTVSISGVYGGEADPMPMMELFDRQVQIRMGQCNVKRWVDDIMPLVQDGSDPLGTGDWPPTCSLSRTPRTATRSSRPRRMPASRCSSPRERPRFPWGRGPARRRHRRVERDRPGHRGTAQPRGMRVVLASRSREALESAALECSGGATLVVPTDVSSVDEVEALFYATIERFGRVDAVVHSAAVLAYGRFEDVPADVFERSLDVTVVGTANVARAALRRFHEQGSGRLVVIGSLLGKIATPYMSSHVTAKWAVHGLVRCLQIEARQTPGIDISRVSPGASTRPSTSRRARMPAGTGCPRRRWSRRSGWLAPWPGGWSSPPARPTSGPRTP
jgi:NAD(P)-dependent dehydrogenase (short-subunit alcohol dehydrogenase family)